MTPTEFIEGLAEVMKVQGTELATVDRALAKHGLRQIARGRSRPNIKLIEGIQIACAWAGAKTLTKAAEEIERQRSCIVSIDGLVDRYLNEHQKAFGMELSALAGKNFLDVVSLVTCQLGKGRYPVNDLWISIEKQGSVEIGYRDGRRKPRLGFIHLSTYPIPWSQNLWSQNVKINVVIQGPVLKWIYDATEGA